MLKLINRTDKLNACCSYVEALAVILIFLCLYWVW